MSTMTQCHLVKESGEFDTRWIESKFAAKGKHLRVKTTNEIWIVSEVGATWPTERVLAYERDFVNMAFVTDSFRDKNGRRTLPDKQ